MLIKTLTLRNHLALGELSLSFTDELDTPFGTVILAGANGCGKTVLLETIQNLFEWTPEPDAESIELLVDLDQTNIQQINEAGIVHVPHAFDSLRITYARSTQPK